MHTTPMIIDWPFRFACGLAMFLLITGLIFICLPVPADLFLGMLTPGSDPAHLQLVGIRQFVYGLTMVAALWQRQAASILIIFGIGSCIPLADAYVAWTQTGVQGGMGHFIAALASIALTWALFRSAKQTTNHYAKA